MKYVIVHKAALVHLGKACVATFAAFCAVLAPRVIAALATTDPVNGEIDLFGEDYLRLTIGVSLSVGVGTMLMMWKQPFDPPKIFTVALSFPALLAGGFNMTESVQELAARTTEVAVKSMSELKELDVPIEEPESISKSEPLSTIHFIQPSIGENKKIFNYHLIENAYAGNGAEADGFPLHISQLVTENQYLIVLKTYSNINEAKQGLVKFRKIISGATVVRTTKKYYVVASGTPSSIDDATQRVRKIKNLLRGKEYLGYSLSLLPIKRSNR